MVGSKLKESGYGGSTPAGIVLSGGGASTVGIIQACKRTLSLPVRIGIPQGLSGLIEEINSPDFATAYGLILYGFKNSEHGSDGGFSFGKLGAITNKIHVGGVAKKTIDFIKSFLP